MEYRTLGRTGLKVSKICLGTMTWGQQNTEAEGHAQMDYALERGINFFDTAELYPIPPEAETQGRTETYIGNWFKARGNRDKVILASKVVGRTENAWFRDGGSLRLELQSAESDPRVFVQAFRGHPLLANVTINPLDAGRLQLDVDLDAAPTVAEGEARP